MEVDHPDRVISERFKPEWSRPRVRPHNLWVKEVDDLCQKVLGLCRVSVWRLVQRDPKKLHHKLQTGVA